MAELSREKAVLAVLRRFIPGDFSRMDEVSHPRLEAAGIYFSDAKILDPCRGAMGALVSPVASSRQSPFREAIAARGSWCLFHDPACGSPSGSSVFATLYAEEPHWLVRSLEGVRRGNDGFIVIRPMLGNFVATMQLSLLKGLFK